MIGKFIVSTAAASLAWLSASAACAETWKTYRNERFGTSADYPGTWTADPPPANGDGLVFRSQDKRATLTISGINATDSVAAELGLRAKPDSGEMVTYQKRGPRSIVLSGLKGPMIFYRKSLISCGIAGDLSIEYPAADKSIYDGMVAHVAASLKVAAGNCR